jgi:hypothetical protein
MWRSDWQANQWFLPVAISTHKHSSSLSKNPFLLVWTKGLFGFVEARREISHKLINQFSLVT